MFSSGRTYLANLKHPVLQGTVSSLYLVVFVGDLKASVAQLAEQLICNQQVVGSSPSASFAADGSHDEQSMVSPL
jgi:hypothetical protein